MVGQTDEMLQKVLEGLESISGTTRELAENAAALETKPARLTPAGKSSAIKT